MFLETNEGEEGAKAGLGDGGVLPTPTPLPPPITPPSRGEIGAESSGEVGAERLLSAGGNDFDGGGGGPEEVAVVGVGG